MLQEDDRLHPSKLNGGQFLCLRENVICLDYCIQIQYYPPLFGQLHNAFLKRDVLFQRVIDHPKIPTIFEVDNPSKFFGSLWF